MRLFATYSHFKFVNRQIIDPVLRINSIQVTLLLKFILMCQFYASPILISCHSIPMQLVKYKDKENLHILSNAKMKCFKMGLI